MFVSALALILAAAPAVKLSSPVESKDGAWSRSLTFTDKTGEHVVKFELTAPKSKKVDDDMYERSRLLTVVHTIGKKEVWRAKDFVEKCEFDLALDFVDGSIEVTDLDDDGEAEISFLYKLGCRSDVSPLGTKLLMYEGATKYALRGDSRERVGEKEFMGGQFKADPAFDKAPKQFLPFASTQWKKLIVDAAEAAVQ
ncbi:MAG: hypothetical protein QM817_04240 [Archangium sp.]